MQSDWILDVLTDLKTFATINGFPALAEQLDDTAIVALAEISARKDRTGQKLHGNDLSQVRPDIGGTGTNRHV